MPGSISPNEGLDIVHRLQGLWKSQNTPELAIPNVEQVISGVVFTNYDGSKGINYPILTAVLIEAIKALEAAMPKPGPPSIDDRVTLLEQLTNKLENFQKQDSDNISLLQSSLQTLTNKVTLLESKNNTPPVDSGGGG